LIEILSNIYVLMLLVPTFYTIASIVVIIWKNYVRRKRW